MQVLREVVRGEREKHASQGVDLEGRGITHHLRNQSGVERTPAYQFVGVAGEITHRLSASRVCFNSVF